jgi:hypothetical protein
MDSAKPTCEIYGVAHKNAFRWKWRYAGVRDGVVECVEEYEQFFECVHAARARGYEPRARWTGGALLFSEKTVATARWRPKAPPA